jgi:hypothetical protein
MNRNVLLPFAAALAGGAISHFVWAPPAEAQSQKNAAPVEMRAQNFTLVDSEGNSIAQFRAEGKNRIVLRGPDGALLWSAGGSPIHPLSSGVSH